MSHVVYRHFAADGSLLYVGRSMTVLARTLVHIHGSAWCRQIARIELEHFDTKEESMAEEARLIAAESPRHNKCGNRPLKEGEVEGTVAATIRDLMRQGLTQTDMHKATGLKQCTLSRWAAGKAPVGADGALALQALLVKQRAMK